MRVSRPTRAKRSTVRTEQASTSATCWFRSSLSRFVSVFPSIHDRILLHLFPSMGFPTFVSSFSSMFRCSPGRLHQSSGTNKTTPLSTYLPPPRPLPPSHPPPNHHLA